MSDQFRVVSPEASELQPILNGLFGEYAARYGDYFSRDAEVELTEWYLAPQGLLWSGRGGEIIATGAYKPYDKDTAEIKRIWTKAACVSRTCGACSAGTGTSGAIRGLQPDISDHRISPAGGRQTLFKRGYDPQFDTTRNPEEYSQPPFDGRLRFTKLLTIAGQARIA